MRTALSRLGKAAGLAALLALVATPASAENERGLADKRASFADHLSSGAALHYYLAHPSAAPEGLSDRVTALSEADVAPSVRAAATSTAVAARFTNDTTGLPQNEESVTVCPENPQFVLGGTNDYRGLISKTGDFTGWHFSRDSGKSLYAEGQLPGLTTADGTTLPSGGDPVVDALPGCVLYAASLNYNDDLTKNGIGLYRSNSGTLSNCPGGDAPSCWPDRLLVAEGAPGHFLDKEWMTVGLSGSAGKVVWVTWSDFNMNINDPTNEAGFTASIMAARCTASLRTCTAPQKISGGDRDVQFSDVTIDDQGRTYISWSEIQGELEGTPQTFIHKVRVAEPGSLDFGPIRTIYAEDQAIPFGGTLNANSFRIATYLKSTVTMVGGKPRIFATWDACGVRVLTDICEASDIKLSYSDDLGRTWTGPQVVSGEGNDYFPTIDQDGAGRLALAYYTTKFDPVFENRQDVELATLDAASVTVTKRQRLTEPSNEPEADPLLGARFIGDYIEVAALNGRAWVHSNENYVKVRLLGQGVPVPQQDNYLRRADL